MLRSLVQGLTCFTASACRINSRITGNQLPYQVPMPHASPLTSSVPSSESESTTNEENPQPGVTNRNSGSNWTERAVRTKTAALDRPTWSCAYGDVCYFGVELPRLQHSVVSSASAETLIASSERKSFSFAKI